MLALRVVAKATLSRYARLEPPVGSHPLKMQIIKKPTQMSKLFYLKLVGERGFEPPTHWSQTSCATKLRYSPLELLHLYDIKWGG